MMDSKCNTCWKPGHLVKDCRGAGERLRLRCYLCNQVGHAKKDYSSMPKDGSQTPSQPAHAYALEAAPSSSTHPVVEKGKKVIIEGVLSISGFPVRTLLILELRPLLYQVLW